MPVLFLGLSGTAYRRGDILQKRARGAPSMIRLQILLHPRRTHLGKLMGNLLGKKRR